MKRIVVLFTVIGLILALCLSGYAARLAYSASNANTVEILDLTTGKIIKVCATANGVQTPIVFSDEGNYLYFQAANFNGPNYIYEVKAAAGSVPSHFCAGYCPVRIGAGIGHVDLEAMAIFQGSKKVCGFGDGDLNVGISSTRNGSAICYPCKKGFKVYYPDRRQAKVYGFPAETAFISPAGKSVLYGVGIVNGDHPSFYLVNLATKLKTRLKIVSSREIVWETENTLICARYKPYNDFARYRISTGKLERLFPDKRYASCLAYDPN